MASRTPPLDPRIANPPEPEGSMAEDGVRPVVAMPRSGLPTAVLIAGMIAAAIILFMILDSRRRAPAEPAVKVRASDTGGIAAPPPPLYIPPTLPPAELTIVPAPALPVTVPPEPVRIPPQQYIPQAVPYIPPPQPIQTYQPPPPPTRQASGPTLVIDTTTGDTAATGPGGVPGSAGGQTSLADTFTGDQSVPRVRSGIFANRSATVAQSTLIPAVLETAFDSRRPGFARAIVSRDVRGFDGTRILIPRGSRLTGEYRSDIQSGQKRALINWTRLIRPDGVTIAIGSPTADTLGRGGVRGDYNSHFFQRFAGALLQSALDVGVNAASRAAAGSVVVALPGSTQNMGQTLQSSRIVPTLTVPAGTSISVFVARDLDFSTSEGRR